MPVNGGSRDGRRVLVTGATGFVGRTLCDRLSRAGWHVVQGVRAKVPGDSPQLVLGDLQDYPPNLSLAGIDVIVHLAARVHRSGGFEEQTAYDTENAKATLALAEAASASGVTHFVFVSSVKAMGESFGEASPAAESSRCQPQDSYARSKAVAERDLLALGTRMGVTVLRPPLVYGAGVGANFAAIAKVAASRWPLPVGALNAPRSMIHVLNLCSAIQRVMEDPGSHGQVFLVRDGRDLSVRSIVRKLRAAGGRRSLTFPVPPQLVTIAGRMLGRGLVAQRLTAPLVVDDSKIRSSLKWRPPLTVEQGLEEFLGFPQRAKRIVFVVTEDWYFWSHRVGLARRVRDAGWEVHVACRVSKHGDLISNEGFELHPLQMARTSRNPLRDLGFLRQLNDIFGKVRPDVVHNVALKPALYGSLVSRRRDVPVNVSTIAGLGSLFASDGSNPNGISGLSRKALVLGLRLSQKPDTARVIVQNQDDYEFVRGRIIDEERLTLIAGSGLRLEDFPYAPRQGDPDEEVVVTHVSRMLWDKGVEQALEAVLSLRRRGLKVRLQIVGAPDPEHPRSIPAPVLESWDALPGVDWLGHRTDIAEIWQGSDIAVLASFYGEGIPRALLEAAATGLPLIACDASGTRDLIEHEVNGLLVVPRDSLSLANAIERLVRSPQLAASLGRAARERVIQMYSDDVVLSQVLALYEEALGLGLPTVLRQEAGMPA